MINERRPTRRRHAARRGLTLVEAALSTVLVGTMLVVALNTVGASRLGQVKTADQRQGNLLAQALMSEILQQDYLEPDAGGTDIFVLEKAGLTLIKTPPALGPDTGETDGTRSAFDDVDDYNAWSASPPEDKQGTPLSNLDGWARSVVVETMNPALPTQPLGTDRGIKRITVTVTRNSVPAAELVAIRTIGLPPPGTYDLKVLLIVTDDKDPNEHELARQTLMESWGFAVTLFQVNGSQAAFDEAITGMDVGYVPMEIDPDYLGANIWEAPIGFVNEHCELTYEFGFASDTLYPYVKRITVTDNTHYITSEFPVAPLVIFSSSQLVYAMRGSTSADAQWLAETKTNPTTSYPSLAVIEKGAESVYGGTTPGRRVQLPWGGYGFNFDALNDNGQTIMKQAIEWAAEQDEASEAVCGDGTCDAGEDPCECPDDCGTPAEFEQPGDTCDDGLDNDCDGVTDCDDINCPTDPACCKGNGEACSEDWECCSNNCRVNGKCGFAAAPL